MRLRQTAKTIVLWICRAAGLFRLARYLTTRRAFLIIGWHGVSIADEHQRFPNLFISPETLRRRLAFLERNFRIVSLDTAVEQHARGTIEPRLVALTFDDGFANFHSAAVPILREFHAPATVYVVSAPVEQGVPIYPLLIEDLVLTAPGHRVRVDVGEPREHTLHTQADRRALIDQARAHCATLEQSNGQATAFVRNLAGALSVDLDPILAERRWHSLTPEELHTLADDGFSIQVHTHNHRNVVNHLADAQHEVDTCRTFIEHVTHRPARDFCYPSGFWNRAAWPVLERGGLRSAVTTHDGPNFAETPPLALRRHIDGEYSTQLEFEYAVSGLGWLLHTLRHPARRYVPSEKSAPYHRTGITY
jgi:peptidoglycan/xylan/chitin deacetylase (PgdA/CDA1 family)